MLSRLLKPTINAATLRNPPQWLIESLGATPVTSGISVTPNTAMTFTAVFAAVRVLAESVASLPLKIYRRRSDGGKEVFADHPAYGLLHDSPNESMTSFQYREALQGHLCTWGNAYSEIRWNRGPQSDPMELMPLRPDRVTPTLDDSDGLIYEVTDDQGLVRVVLPEMMFHVKGLSFDGLYGYAPIALAREAIGLGLAAEKYGASFFGNNAVPAAVFKHPAKLSDEAVKNLKRDWEAMHKGAANSNKIAVMREGLDIATIGVPNDDAQFLETRKFQVSEIARIFRVPPHMIGDLERATFTNIEQQALEFVIHTLRPWLIRWEQEINMKLLHGDPNVFCEFSVDALLRGETKTRYEAHASAINAGWKTRNEVRVQENLNPEDGLDDFLTPMNMAGNSQEAVDLAAQTVQQTVERLHRKEVKAVTGASKRYLERGNTDKFVEWLEPFYLSFRQECVDALEAPMSLQAILDDKPVNVEAVVSDYISRRLDRIRATLRVNASHEHIADCLGGMIGDNETEKG